MHAIIGIMRSLLFCLLILLTALRGMVGDAMALEMARTQSPASVSVPHAAVAASPKTTAHPCHEEASPSKPDAEQTSSPCTDCQVCHSLALQRLMAFSTLYKLATTYAAPDAWTWMSADLIHQQKPPLS